MRRAVPLMPLLFALLALPVLLAAPAARADSGMWTFHNFPANLVKEKYGAQIDQAWLDRVRTSVIRLSNCTASFVSPDGLILTSDRPPITTPRMTALGAGHDPEMN